ncbi:unknown [Bacteroides caccae CAG:21]|nr:unknown [Bacteroides caccae CAG:21]
MTDFCNLLNRLITLTLHAQLRKGLAVKMKIDLENM